MKKLLFAIALMAMMPACKKEDAPATVDLTINSSNFVGTYKITAITFTTGSTVLDIYSSTLDPCEKDDTHQFTAAGAYTMVDAGVTCTPPTATVTGPYTLTGSTITFNGETYTIESIKQTGSSVSVVIAQSDTYVFSGTTFNGTARLTLTR
jgi:hypothetical protein